LVWCRSEVLAFDFCVGEYIRISASETYEHA
jgi:hypothetical protein